MLKEGVQGEGGRWSVPLGGMQNVHVLLVFFDLMRKHTHKRIHFHARKHTHQQNSMHSEIFVMSVCARET